MYDCCDEDVILAFIDGGLSRSQRDTIEAHLDLCAACRETMVYAMREAPEAVAPLRPSGTRSEASTSEALVPDPILPTSAGRYVVLGLLGSGGMGSVCAALDPRLGRPVAIKFLHPVSSVGDALQRARALRREGRILATLRNPHVVEVFDIGGLDAAQPFVAMALLDGTSLAQWVRENAPSLGERLEILHQAGRGLAAAHAVGVLHRDFKPSNVMVTRQGRAVVVDFGLGGSFGGNLGGTTAPHSADAGVSNAGESNAGESNAGELSGRGLSSATETMAKGGTPQYMAPEQHRGEALDPRADQFSFCATAWWVLTGGHPFDAEDVEPPAERARTLERLKSHVGPSIARGAMPAGIAKVLHRGLSARPEHRFTGMNELLDALERARAPRRRYHAVVGVGTVAVAGVAWLASSGRVEVDCTANVARAASRWTPADREAVHTAFDNASPRLTADAWATSSSLIDAYVASWTEQHSEACALTSDPGAANFDDAMTCLRRADTSLAAAIRRLLTADESTVERATELVSALPDPTLCLHPHASSGTLNPSSERHRVGLAQLRADLDAGMDESIIAPLEKLVADARAHADRAAAIEGLILLGRARRANHPEAAYSAWDEAVWSAIEVGADAWVVDAATRAADLSVETEHGLTQARRWLELARASAQRQGPDDSVRARLEAGEAAVAQTSGEYASAVAHARAALAARRSSLGDDHPEVLEDRRRLSLALAAADQTEAAVEVAREARAQSARVFGPHHPRVAEAAATLAHALHVNGDYEGALAAAEEALTVCQTARGPAHQQTAAYHRRVAETQWQLGRSEPATEHFEAALETYRALYGDVHLEVATTLGSLALLDAREGRYENALERYREALFIFTRQLGERSDAAGMTHAFRARAFAALDRLGEARAEAELGVEILTESLGRGSSETANTLNVLGEVLARQGDVDAAKAAYAESNQIYAAVFGEAHPTTATARITYVHFLVDHEMAEQAGPEVDRVLAAIGQGSTDPVFVADATFAKARTLDALGEHREARRLAKEAIGLYRQHPPVDEAAVEYVQGWLRQ